jgi:phosphopantothenoylcysteine decarboxylase/phosphopantothenate--cysteine ligase
MTESAERFITPLTFQALSGFPVRTSLWDEGAEAAMGHIELARWASQVVIAPASADVIARIAHGLANDLLTTLCLATAAPIALAPAMNQQMWANSATQANLATLRARGVAVHGPGEGDQACGEVGAGRMLEPTELVAALAAAVLPQRLSGRRIVVSAGPTYEDLDPVRFIGNRSSGRMGFAVAAAAIAMGAQVELVAGPVALATPAGVRRTDVRSAAQMREAVLAMLPADAYIGAAAVADYAPAAAQPHKRKRTAGELTQELVRTPENLAEDAAHPRRPRCVVGFAAETQDLEKYARGKLEAKKLDLIAANDVSQPGRGFDSERNALVVLSRDGRTEIPEAGKAQVAAALLALVADRLETAS